MLGVFALCAVIGTRQHRYHANAFVIPLIPIFLFSLGPHLDERSIGRVVRHRDKFDARLGCCPLGLGKRQGARGLARRRRISRVLEEEFERCPKQATRLLGFRGLRTLIFSFHELGVI